MRHDSRYTRVRGIITDPVIPRLANGGPALCHFCQRSITFSGGFLRHLQKQLDRIARYPGNRPGSVPGCPKRCNGRVYDFRRPRLFYRCGVCRMEFSQTSATEHKGHKLPVEVREAIKAETASGEWGAISRAAKKYGVNYQTAWRLAAKPQ